MNPSPLPSIKLPIWVYELLTILVALVWVATVAACFALSFLGKPVPSFASTQLEWMTLALGCVLAIPRSKRKPSEDPTESSLCQPSTQVPSAEGSPTPDDAASPTDTAPE